MSYSPSIGDIVLVCQFAWTTFSNFKNAPSEFEEIARDCKDIHRVLALVHEQCKDRWAPMNRSSQSRAAMQTCITECNTTLHLLSDRLKNYESLGSATPKALERVKFITVNFMPLCNRLRQDRDKINAQLHLGTNDIVGRIYHTILKVAADMRAGRRERTIISAPNDNQEDTWTVITREMQLEPYVQQLQREGAFDESALDGRDQEEIYPSDSITEVNSQISNLSFAHHGPSSRATSDKTSISNFRGVPIYEISYGTIFNPNINVKGIPIPDTFDVWELARLSWSLQRRCTTGIPGIREDQKTALRATVDHLTKQDPVLLLILAKSSTEKSFWTQLDKMKPRKDCQSFLQAGRAALRTLNHIDTQVSLFQSRPNAAISAEAIQTPHTTLQTRSKRSVFSLRRSKPATKIITGSATSFTPSLPFTHLLTLGAYMERVPIRDRDYQEPGPKEWERIIYYDCLAISQFFGYKQR
jgi:hypothetical protein